jgi:spore coat protein A
MRKDKIKKKFRMKLSRRQVLKAGLIGGAGLMVPWKFRPRSAFAANLGPGLSNPTIQPKFVETVPNALHPGFIFPKRRTIAVGVGQTSQETGLVDGSGNRLSTPVWGYGYRGAYTWPGKTFEVNSNRRQYVLWTNNLRKFERRGRRIRRVPLQSILTGKDNRSIGEGNYTDRSVYDTSLHWAYSLHGYEQYTLENDGVPIVPHVHGGHTKDIFDGNPEFFFSPDFKIRGPRWRRPVYRYDNDQPAGTIWYHDHALGITRLNVYAGMAGFYIIRDNFDTGKFGNPLDLPAFPYEAALAIQDRMFKDNGELFYPAFPGDPFYGDFITGEGAFLPDDQFPGGGPTGLAEFFGDHMLVNGKIWPKMEVEPRNYRFRCLNGCDSRFLAVQFFEVPPGATDFSNAKQHSFTVIGSDQGLASSPTTVDTLVMETGSRYDIIFDFKKVAKDNRVIMKNIGGDEPFGGGLIINDGPRDFPEMNRIMAFDVVLDYDSNVPDASPSGITFGPEVGTPTRPPRKVALFEGTDEYGRLQPILGTAEPATDYAGNPINWPNTKPYIAAGLVGQMEGAIAWHSPTTENPALHSTEIWEILNVTGDAHPVHLHLVNFEVLGRKEIVWDSRTDEEDRVLSVDPNNDPGADGTYLVAQPVVQHNTKDTGDYGNGFKIANPTYGNAAEPPQKPDAYVENAPKDMVTALPDQVTIIKATFDRPGRYVWHCHILSHEDHEMMRVLHVGPGA